MKPAKTLTKLEIPAKVAIPLKDYIRIFYAGNKSEFAEAFGLYRQNVNSLINRKVFVMDGELYRPLAKWATGDNSSETTAENKVES